MTTGTDYILELDVEAIANVPDKKSHLKLSTRKFDAGVDVGANLSFQRNGRLLWSNDLSESTRP